MSSTSGVGVGRILVVNGVPQTSDVPPVSSILESISGAYTTTRTSNNATLVLFWNRHLRRLAQSVAILASTGAQHNSFNASLINICLRLGLDVALDQRSRSSSSDELAITTIVKDLDVCLHIGFYSPVEFGVKGLRLAIAGKGRDLAAAKYSDWVWLRKNMEKMRPPLVNELLLSNDGDRILEGSLTNFFVVCRRVVNDVTDASHRETLVVQTAPLCDGVLPGVIRQLVIEICSSKGIPVEEVAPSWLENKLWEEAFITNSLRLVQHVEVVQAPSTWNDIEHKTWKDVLWIEKQFQGVGIITKEIQLELTRRALSEGHRIVS